MLLNNLPENFLTVKLRKIFGQGRQTSKRKMIFKTQKYFLSDKEHRISSQNVNYIVLLILFKKSVLSIILRVPRPLGINK